MALSLGPANASQKPDGDGGADPVGPDQQIGPVGGPVGEPELHAVPVLPVLEGHEPLAPPHRCRRTGTGTGTGAGIEAHPLLPLEELVQHDPAEDLPGHAQVAPLAQPWEEAAPIPTPTPTAPYPPEGVAVVPHDGPIGPEHVVAAAGTVPPGHLLQQSQPGQRTL